VTLVEFVARLKGSTQRDVVLATLYFKQRYDQVGALTADQVRGALVHARVPRASKMNVPDVLAKSGAFVDTPGTKGNARLWHITTAGEAHVRGLLSLPEAEPEIEHDIGNLKDLVAKIKDKDVRDYVEEAIKCLSVGALRACVVFLWAGAIRTIHAKMMSASGKALNDEIIKHDQKGRSIARIEDFSYIRDETVLLAAEGLGILDKNERGTLKEALDLRNKCGHPGKYRPGPKKVSAFIEDISPVVFS
jgi:hypothetical protein